MRLSCPNCDAQYEVMDDVIPTEGRDVQCSDCGQTWFQHHPDHTPEDVAAPDAEPEADDATVEGEERVAAPAVSERRNIDSSVSDILREEAEREAKARASEALESQPELGLEGAESESARRIREARKKMAKIRGEEAGVGEAAATAAALGSRRDLLPDIEKINSTLRSSGDRQSSAADAASEAYSERVEFPPSKSAFRLGFLAMILVAVLLGALYVFAPEIARAVPQTEPVLSAYVAQVDAARAWLDGQVTSLLSWLDAVASAQEE